MPLIFLIRFSSFRFFLPVPELIVSGPFIPPPTSEPPGFLLPNRPTRLEGAGGVRWSPRPQRRRELADYLARTPAPEVLTDPPGPPNGVTGLRADKSVMDVSVLNECAG